MKNRSRLLTVLLYIVVFAVAVVLISEVFFRDDTVYVNYSTVCEQFRSENVRSFDYDNGVLTLELRKPYQNEAYSVSHKLADLGLFYEDLGTLIAEQQESGVLQSYNYVPMRQTPWYVRMLPEMLLSVIMIALVYMVLMRNSGGMMKFGHANARVGSGRDKVMFSDVAGAERGKGRAAGDRRFPARSRKIPPHRRAHPQGRAARRPSGHGQDAAGPALWPVRRMCSSFSISGSDFVELYVGVGASRVRDLFEQAKRSAPAIIFIDEIDAVGRRRGAGMGGGHDEREQTLNQLLVEMDGFGSNEGVIVMAATNRRDILDPALLRPGRFDRQIYVNVPDVRRPRGHPARPCADKQLSDDVDLRTVAQRDGGLHRRGSGKSAQRGRADLGAEEPARHYDADHGGRRPQGHCRAGEAEPCQYRARPPYHGHPRGRPRRCGLLPAHAGACPPDHHCAARQCPRPDDQPAGSGHAPYHAKRDARPHRRAPRRPRGGAAGV